MCDGIQHVRSNVLPLLACPIEPVAKNVLAAATVREVMRYNVEGANNYHRLGHIPNQKSEGSKLTSVVRVQTLMRKAQITLARPTHPSSKRILDTAAIMTVSTSKIKASTKHAIWAALDGEEKKRRTVKSRPKVRVVKEKSKNPEPRECIPGGLMKMDTKSSTHHRKVIMAKKTVK